MAPTFFIGFGYSMGTSRHVGLPAHTGEAVSATWSNAVRVWLPFHGQPCDSVCGRIDSRRRSDGGRHA